MLMDGALLDFLTVYVKNRLFWPWVKGDRLVMHLVFMGGA